MNYLKFSQQSITPYTEVYIQPGVSFTSYNSATNSSHVKMTVIGDSDINYEHKFLITSIRDNGNIDYVLSRRKHLSNDYFEEFSTGSDILVGNYKDDKTINIEDYAKIEISSFKDFSMGDQWIFVNIDDYDLTDRLVSCSALSYQSGSTIDQFTYLGNTFSIEILKDDSNLLNQNFEKNIFHVMNYKHLGYYSKFKIITGIIENGSKTPIASFVGYLEDINEKSNTVEITLGDGIYLTKEIHAHNVGTLIKNRDLRQLGRTYQILKSTDLEILEETNVNIHKPNSEINFETHYKPVVKEYPRQKLFIRRSGESSEEEVELSSFINRVGILEKDNAMLHYDNGIIEFESPPLEKSGDDILLTFKHAYNWRHPTFLANELFKSVGFDTSIDSSSYGGIKNKDESFVFNNQGRVLNESEDRSSEVTYSMAHHHGLFYFAVGDKIIIMNESTGEKFIVNDELGWNISNVASVDVQPDEVATKLHETKVITTWAAEKDSNKNACIYKVLIDDSPLSGETDEWNTWNALEESIKNTLEEPIKWKKSNLVIFIANTKFITLEDDSFIYPDGRPGSHVKVLNIEISNIDTEDHKQGYPLNYYKPNLYSSNPPRIVFSTPKKLLGKYLEVQYTLMGTPENKDYSNKAFIKQDEIYFIFQVKQKYVENRGDIGNITYPKVKNILVRRELDSDFIFSTGNISLNENNNWTITGITPSPTPLLKADDFVIIMGATDVLRHGIWRYDGDEFKQHDGYQEKFYWANNDKVAEIESSSGFWERPSLQDPTYSLNIQYINLGAHNCVELETWDSPFIWKTATNYDAGTLYASGFEYDWEKMWGRLPKARCDFYLDKETGKVWTLETIGDGGAHYKQHSKHKMLVGEIAENHGATIKNTDGDFRVTKYNDFDTSSNPSKALIFEKDFDDFWPDFYEKNQADGKSKYHEFGFHSREKNEINEESLHNCLHYIPFDIWGLCVIDDGTDQPFFSFCTHWKNRVFHRDTRFRDHKGIVFYNKGWLSTDNLSYVLREDQENPNTTSVFSTNSKLFKTQRFLFQGTREFKTFGDRVEYETIKEKYYSKGSEGESLRNIYGVQDIGKASNLLTWDTLKYELRGQDELSMIAKNPIVWTNEDNEKVILYQCGHFGKYISTGLLANPISDLKNYWWREAGLNVSIKVYDKATSKNNPFTKKNLSKAGGALVGNCTLYPPHYAENSHGRIVQFKPTTGDVLNNVKWRYLGYTHAESQTNVYKEFSTEFTIDDKNSLHFTSARSIRIDVNYTWDDWKETEDWINYGRDYLCGGYRAINDELDLNILQDLDNFMWVNYSDVIVPKVPVANFNDKYVYEVLKSLALILDYEFGIENGVAFFRVKNNKKYLLSSLTVDDDAIKNELGYDITHTLEDDSLYYIYNSTLNPPTKNEIVYVKDNKINRGMFDTVGQETSSGSIYLLLKAILDDGNIVNINSFKTDVDFIYDKINSSFSYYSNSEKSDVTFNISRKIPYQTQFKRTFDLPIEFISSRVVASGVVDRYEDYLSTEHRVIDLSIQYMPFLKNGDYVLIQDIEGYGIQKNVFQIISCGHDLKEFKTNIKARSFFNAILQIT